ncbi:hypothetical protein AXG93_2964s1280 [Marchantia polymorpha subsp. ruderalis]|uniref:BHLH domain-containing protein n=1 Tax=Marchantia polymorpha subsp. ruderalis TaxID=1480154 RepID=A0A176VKL6_MARPO|nr:hypothetical protein AXG93_2964s1280 [Marchantia polymorpha subsp. ruderalis]
MAANSENSTCNSDLTEATADSAHLDGSNEYDISDIDPYFSGEIPDQNKIDKLNKNLLILATILPTVPAVDEMSIIDTTIESIIKLQQTIQELQREAQMADSGKNKVHTYTIVAHYKDQINQ